MAGVGRIAATLEFYHLPRFGGGRHVETRTFAVGTTVRDVLVQYGLDTEAGLTHLVNGRHADRTHVIEDGDLVSVFYQPEGG